MLAAAGSAGNIKARTGQDGPANLDSGSCLAPSGDTTKAAAVASPDDDDDDDDDALAKGKVEGRRNL